MKGKKDKILVLVMSCNRPQYLEKEQVVRDTWGKDVLDKKYDNIDLWFFTSGEEDKVDRENHKIFTKCSDLRDRTFQKLMKTLYIVEKENLEYDWILRVNTSTYINIELVDKILQHSPSDEYMYSGTMFCQPWILNKLPFLSGEYLVLSKKYIQILKKFYETNKAYFDKLENDPRTDTKWVCDDGWITTCMSKVYKADKDFWNYSKVVHSTGICFYNKNMIPDPDGDNQDDCREIAWCPGICYKTCFEGDPDLDIDPIHQDLDISKARVIHEICERYKPVDIDEWYKWYILNVYDKWCYPYEHVVASQSQKRDMSKRITKREMFKWYQRYLSDNKKKKK